MADLREHPELRPFVLSNVRLTGTKIGAGAYGSVEKVAIPGAVCAAKKIHDIFQGRSEIQAAEIQRATKQFVEECQLMSTLRHPHIVQFLGVCFFPGSRLPALVMELLLTSLHNLLDPDTGGSEPDTNKGDSSSEPPPLPPPDAPKPFFPLGLKQSILYDVARGLAYLHDRSPPIVHRDLSARNVLLNSAMVAKIADVGVARIVHRIGAAATMTKAPRASIYMPPEALEAKSGEEEDSSKYDTSIDIFSFGVVAIFTLSQTFPCNLLAPKYLMDSTYDQNDWFVARNELERRDEYMQKIYKHFRNDHPLIEMIKGCLHNIYEKRPDIHEVLQLLEQTRAEISDEESDMNKLELVQALQSQPRNQSSMREIADLQQQLSVKEAELTRAQETIEREQQQNQELREQAQERWHAKLARLLPWASGAAEGRQQLRQQEAEREELVQAKDRELAQAQQQLRQQEAEREELVQAKDRELAQAQQQLRQQEAEREELVQAKDRELAQAQQQLRQQEAEREELVQSKDRELAHAQQQLRKQEAERDELVQAKGRELAQAQQQLRQQEAERDELVNAKNRELAQAQWQLRRQEAEREAKERELAQAQQQLRRQEIERDEQVQAKDRELAQAQRQLRRQEAEREAKDRELTQAQRQLRRQEAEREAKDRELAQAQQQLRRQEAEREAKNRELAQAQQQLRRQEAERETKDRELAQAQRQLRRQEAERETKDRELAQAQRQLRRQEAEREAKDRELAQARRQLRRQEAEKDELVQAKDTETAQGLQQLRQPEAEREELVQSKDRELAQAQQQLRQPEAQRDDQDWELPQAQWLLRQPDAERDELVQAKDRELAQAQQKLRQHEAETVAKDRELAQIQQQLRQQEAERDELMQSKDREIAQAQQQLRQQEVEREAKNTELAQAQHASERLLRQLRQLGVSSKRGIGDLQQQNQELKQQLQSIEVVHRETNAKLEALRAKVTTENRQATPFISGADIIARATEEVVPGEPYRWSECGLTVHIPADAMDPNAPPTTMTIHTSLSGHYQLPDHTQLVSAFYLITFPEKLSRPVTLEMQHCAHLQNPEHLSSLSFVTAKYPQAVLPYEFDILPGGVFTTDCQYGRIELSHFCWVAIVIEDIRRWWTLDRVYAVRPYYIKQESQSRFNDVHIAIVWDLEAYFRMLDKIYTSDRPGPKTSVNIRQDEVKLKSPTDGNWVDLTKGWFVCSLISTKLPRSLLDRYHSSHSIPTFQLRFEAKKTSIEPLSYKLEFSGVEDPTQAFIRIDIDPGVQSHSPPPEVDADDGASANEELTTEHMILVKHYLSKLEKSDVKTLGQLLGLSHETVSNFYDRSLREYLESILKAWFQKKDDVMTNGVPTWKVLVQALEDEKLRQNGIAADIREYKNMYIPKMS